MNIRANIKKLILKIYKITSRWLIVVIPLASFLFIVTEHAGLWNYYRGINLAKNATANLGTGGEGKMIFYPTDKEWYPLIRIIQKNTRAALLKDREPKALARSVAVDFSQLSLGDGTYAYWVAPSTPVYLIYKDWPPKEEVNIEDARVVGNIGELNEWIKKDEEDFKFFWNDIIFAALALYLTMLAFLKKNLN